MGGVDLENMLLALYSVPCETKKWYQKVLWALIDIAKVNSWLLYRRHFLQYDITKKDIKLFLTFSLMTGNALLIRIKWHQQVFGADHRRGEVLLLDHRKEKKLAVANLIDDIGYDQVTHWPQPKSTKNRYQLCRWPLELCANNVKFICASWKIVTVCIIIIISEQRLSQG